MHTQCVRDIFLSALQAMESVCEDLHVILFGSHLIKAPSQNEEVSRKVNLAARWQPDICHNADRLLCLTQKKKKEKKNLRLALNSLSRRGWNSFTHARWGGSQTDSSVHADADTGVRKNKKRRKQGRVNLMTSGPQWVPLEQQKMDGVFCCPTSSEEKNASRDM